MNKYRTAFNESEAVFWRNGTAKRKGSKVRGGGVSRAKVERGR